MDWRDEAEQIRDRERLATPEAPAPEAEPRPLAQLAADVGNGMLARHLGPGEGVLESGQVHPAVESALTSARGGGATLDAAAQERFGGALGDLSDVRVHTDDHADQLSRSVSARAFATGADVYFARGEYVPGSPAGDQLLAHELAHVVQQRGAPASGPLTVTQPGDAHEREADDVARRLA